MAERAGLSVRGISDLKRGARRAPHLEAVRLLADGLEFGPVERTALLHAARMLPWDDPADERREDIRPWGLCRHP